MKSKITPFLALAVFAATARGAALTWDTGPSDGATITAGSGTWQTGSGNWNNAGADANWAAGDTATFAGSDGAYTVTVAGAITTGNSATTGITFNNSGYTLTSAAAQTITLGNAGATSALTVAAGKTATIGGKLTLLKGAAPNSGALHVTGGGSLALGGGAGDITLLQNTGSSPSEIRGGTIFEVKAGATFTNGTSTVLGNNTSPAESGLTNQLKITGGTVNVNSNNMIVGHTQASQTSTEILTISAGLLDIKAAAGTLRLGTATSGTTTVTVNLDGGVINVGKVQEGTGTNAVSTFNFNGGTLKVLGVTNASTFLAGLDTAQIRNGGAIVETNFETTIAQNLTHSAVGGDNATDGGFTKNGTGTLSLGGSLSYTGPTVVNAGKLGILAPNALKATTLNNAGSRLKVTSGASASPVTSLALNTDTGVEFDLGAYVAGQQPSVAVGTLQAVGNYKIDVAGTSIPFNTTITLLTYTSKTGSGVPSIGTLPSGVTLDGPPIDTGSSIQIKVLNGSAAGFTWSKGDGNWNTTDLNWNANAAAYTEPAVVTFPDLGGNNQYAVNLTANRAPSAFTLSNTGDFDTGTAYTFTGSAITGNTGINKSGTGLVTFSNTNAYAGPLAITLGAVVKTVADTTTGPISVADGAGFGLSGVVDGTGQTLTLTGPGNVSNYFFTGSGAQRGALQAISGSNTWAGNIVLAGASGTGGNTRIGVQNGASLTLSGTISESTVGMSPLFRGSSLPSDVITFSGTAAWTGTTRLFSDGGVFALGGNDKFPVTSDLAVGTSAGGTVLDLAGFNQTVAALSGSTDASIRNSGGTPSVLTINPVVANGYNGAIADSISVVVGGTANESFGGDHTYTGNTTINSGGQLTVLNTGELKFYPLANGVTNSVKGSGTLIFDGTIRIDTSNASSTSGNSWTLVDRSTLAVTSAFGDALAVASQDGAFTETSAGSGVWTLTDGSSNTWTFTEADGKLAVGTPGASPYTTWIAGFFPGVTDPLIIGKGADPDKDGVNNLAEFALHGTPNSGSSDGYHVVAIEDTDADSLKELTLTIAVRNAAGSPVFSSAASPSSTVDGVVYAIQGSLDLAFPGSAVTETALPTGLSPLPAGWEYRRFRLNASEPLGVRGFLRVETKPAP